MKDFSKLCIHTITTRDWSIEEAIDRYAEAGVAGITVWRQWLAERDTEQIGERIRQAGLEIVSTCRGGFFPSTTASGRSEAIDENRAAIREAAALGAPMVVLVCGAVPGQSLDLSRQQIADGIAALLPLAEELSVKLAIEPLHPMYADDRSAINSMATANAICDQLDHSLVGIAADVYHLWWDPDLEEQIARAGTKERLFAFHICDWRTPTVDLLNDRGLMGEGCIDIPQIRRWMEKSGFSGFHEVEIFSDRWWAKDPGDFLEAILRAYREFV
ncbi:MAG: sugar phosphate isomerase/epimerase family protein [Verrucomicrobiota bacterium]